VSGERAKESRRAPEKASQKTRVVEREEKKEHEHSIDF
jgi:hypothetical protein